MHVIICKINLKFTNLFMQIEPWCFCQLLVLTRSVHVKLHIAHTVNSSLGFSLLLLKALCQKHTISFPILFWLFIHDVFISAICISICVVSLLPSVCWSRAYAIAIKFSAQLDTHYTVVWHMCWLALMLQCWPCQLKVTMNT